MADLRLRLGVVRMTKAFRISLATATLFTFGFAVAATPAASHDVGAGVGGGPILPGPLRGAHGALATSITLPAGPLSNGITTSITLPAGPLSNGHGGIASSITLPAGPLSNGHGGIASSIALPAGAPSGGVSVGGGN